MEILLFILGIGLIIFGGNFFVDSSVWISDKLRIPKFIIGATIVSIATTLPELTVSVLATCGGKFDMAAGNAIGSIVCNIGLILAISIIAAPSKVGKRKFPAAKSALLLCALIVTLIFSPVLSYLPAAILICIWLAFMTTNIVECKRGEELPSLHTPVKSKDLAINIIQFGLGAAALIFGSNLLVNKGSIIAASCGVPESVIAVTVIAIGTSLPELVTTITALCKKHASLSVGNILGANIMDIALIMPVCSFISGGLILTKQTLMLDLPTCIVFTFLAFILPVIKKKYSRQIGISLLLLYAVYLTLLFIFFI